MSRVRVLDTSAILALWGAHDYLMDRLDDATMLLPAAAIAEANDALRADVQAWDDVLLHDGLQMAPLTGEAAVEVSLWHGPLAVRHSVFEARAHRGLVVTRNVDQYRGYRIPVLAI